MSSPGSFKVTRYKSKLYHDIVNQYLSKFKPFSSSMTTFNTHDDCGRVHFCKHNCLNLDLISSGPAEFLNYRATGANRATVG